MRETLDDSREYGRIHAENNKANGFSVRFREACAETRAARTQRRFSFSCPTHHPPGVEYWYVFARALCACSSYVGGGQLGRPRSVLLFFPQGNVMRLMFTRDYYFNSWANTGSAVALLSREWG